MSGLTFWPLLSEKKQSPGPARRVGTGILSIAVAIPNASTGPSGIASFENRTFRAAERSCIHTSVQSL